MKPNDLPHTQCHDAWSPAQLAVQFVAQVDAPADDAGPWWLRCGEHRLRANLATSLLLEPAVGDRVLCCQTLGDEADGTCILAVLSRPAGGPPLTVRIGDAARLRAEPNGLHIDAPTLSANSQSARLQADEVQVVFKALHAIGDTWAATVKQMRLVGGLFTSVFEREVLHAGQHTRTVEGLARTQAPVIEHDAGTVLHLRGQQVLTNGERLVKTQGAQIHLG